MIPQFALRLICGLSMMWGLLPQKSITSGFFRIQMLLTLGLSVLVSVTASQWPESVNESARSAAAPVFGTGVLLACFSFLGSVFWTLERRQGGRNIGRLVCLISTAGLILPLLWTGSSAVGPQAIEALTSAFLIGSITGAMLLGHWYLTATGMSLEPLKRAVWLIVIAILIRCLWVAISPFSFSSSSHYGMMILRWGGLIGPLILALLTVQILRYRNTQSATGVLYAATILIFMGEMAGVLLQRTQAIPETVWYFKEVWQLLTAV